MRMKINNKKMVRIGTKRIRSPRVYFVSVSDQ